MSRFLRVSNDPSYSELKPERFTDMSEPYIAPEAALEQGIVRAVDDAPELEELRGAGRGDRARVGFEQLKGKR